MKKLFSILIAVTLTLSACACSHAARLPNAGEKNWGPILNEFLLVAHNTDGTLTPNSVSLTNKSGGAVAQYDVVIVGTATDNSFITTTTAGNVNVIGVAQEAIADNASGDVLPPSALTTVNIKAGVTIVRGDYLITSTVAGKADRSAAYTDGAFARALTAGTGTVSAILINQSEDYSVDRTITGNWVFSGTLDIASMLNTDLVTNLNADLLDGISASGFEQIGSLVRAYRSTSQSVPSTTDTDVLFDVENWDTGSNFASSIFTAPRTGYYIVSGQVAFISAIAPANYYVKIFAGVSGSETQRFQFNIVVENANPYGVQLPFNDIVYISAGDVVKIRTYHTTGSTRTIDNGSIKTFVNIREINRIP